jgi:RNA polymerase sigma-70 factor (ECF subfamily)
VETPFEPLERKEMEDLIDELLERLPENQRAALQLQRSECYSYQEIAGVLEVSTMAVKSLLVRARENLKRELERYLDGKNKLIGRKS